ncbi:MAG: serine/threonine-protein kinase [Burkholderiaceae bacterium]
MQLRPGQRIGRYLLEDVLARGGMGVVWRAWDEEASRPVAIKVVADRMINVGDFKARFDDEVRRHSRLTHPNIVAILDVFRFDSDLCMVMNLIEGTSLDILLKGEPDNRLEPARACRIVRDVLAPLDYAHRNGIFHRDVKPSNILLDVNEVPHLTDFGIAVAVGEARRTRAGVAVGTAHYMSPEQIRSSRDIDHRTDVYSVGCMLYEMLTGRPPFTAGDDTRTDSDFIIKSAHLSQRPVPPRMLVPSIPPYLERIVLRALNKVPAERIAGCGSFSQLLEAGADAEERNRGRSAWRRYAWIAMTASIVLATAAAFVAFL